MSAKCLIIFVAMVILTLAVTRCTTVQNAIADEKKLQIMIAVEATEDGKINVTLLDKNGNQLPEITVDPANFLRSLREQFSKQMPEQMLSGFGNSTIETYVLRGSPGCLCGCSGFICGCDPQGCR